MTLFSWRKPKLLVPQPATHDEIVVVSMQAARIEEKVDKLAEWMTVLLRAELERRDRSEPSPHARRQLS